MGAVTVEDAKAVIASHEQYCRAADLENVMTNIAGDIVVLAADAPLVQGAEAFREFYTELFRMGHWDFGHDYSGAEVIGDMVFLHGVAPGTFTTRDGVATEFRNNFIHVLRPGQDGALRVWRAAFAPASPQS